MSDRICRAAALIAAAALGGCSLAPTYRPPVVAAPAAFKEAGPWLPAAPADAARPEPWWTLFGDPTLDGLERQLADANPTIAGAVGRYDAARAYLARARADLFPSVSIGSQLTRNRQSDNRPLRGSNQPDLYAADTASGAAGYELDLWGRVRNSVAAGRAEAEASADDIAAVRLSLAGELASDYIALRGADQQIALLNNTVDDYAQADALTQRRFRGGIASGVDAGRSGAQLDEARAQLSDVMAGRALIEHAIASLVGVPASSFTIAPATTSLAMPAIPAGLPSTLLERRPDVAAAERRMMAANAKIGVARAAFFPSISLGGQGGFQSTALAGLVSAPNLFWSVGPSAVLSLFGGGRRRAQVALARADWDQTTAAYRGNVLRAFQDVEDSLSQLHLIGDEAEAEQQAEIQAAQVETLSLNRYVKGAVTYLDVVTAQTTALRIHRAVIDLTTRRLQASVRLARAVGGGWRVGEAA
ncbi:multidrug efflux RND transporter outer membrane subunit OpmB [Sphingomonas oligophenolica]|uniref:Efflux transporter outer membrane subunit n=1 Tax=Sphingomonas oligophenolica TaxID=301154 RepID=A0ABU9Y735_9SPHN